MRPLPLAAALLLLAAPSGADPLAQPDWRASLALGGRLLPLPAQPLLHPERIGPSPAAPSAPAARSSAGAHAPGVDWLGLFADGTTFFTVPHDGVGLDVRGGAYLQLLHNLSLRGSYRVFDYDQKASDGSLDTGAHGPLFGLRLRF